MNKEVRILLLYGFCNLFTNHSENKKSAPTVPM